MKNINALLTINNNQTFKDKTDTTEIVTECSFYEKENSFFLIYDEYGEIGESRILMKVSDSGIVMKRSGAINARMEFLPGASREILYRLPYGDVIMELWTYSISNSLKKDGGGVEIKYRLKLMDEEYQNDMKLNISLKKTAKTRGGTEV